MVFASIKLDGLGHLLGKLPKFSNDCRRIAATRRQNQWDLELLCTLERTIDDAVDIHSSCRGRNDGNAEPGRDQVQPCREIRNHLTDFGAETCLMAGSDHCIGLCRQRAMRASKQNECFTCKSLERERRAVSGPGERVPTGQGHNHLLVMQWVNNDPSWIGDWPSDES